MSPFLLLPGDKLMVLFVLMALLGAQPTPGPIIAAGGGKLPNSITARALEWAGGQSARVVVIPFASQRPEAGISTVERFTALKAASAEMLDRNSQVRASEQLRRATLVWMVGGSQNRLMDALRERKLVALLRQRQKEGMAIAGSSAGAAVMSQIMIKGGAPVDSVLRGATQTAEGIGVVNSWIVDQHFMKRRRFGRLAAAVLDHRTRGVGIDEGTAVVFHASGKLEVIGRSSAIIIDARGSSTRKGKPGEPHGATNLKLHILTEGMTYK